MPGNTETVTDSALKFKGSSHSHLSAQKESLPPGVVVKCCSVRIMEEMECAPEIKLSLFKGAILRQVLRALGQPRGMGWVGMGSGIGMGNTCKSMADSCQCMAKTTQYCKVISLQLIKINGKKIIKGGHIHQKDLLCQPQPQSEV